MFIKIFKKLRAYLAVVILLYCCVLSSSSFAKEKIDNLAMSSSPSFDTYMEDEDIDIDFGDSSNSSKIYDPFEKVNRKIFVFNEAFDIHLFEHVAKGYRRFVPKFARKSIRNFFNNLSLPITTVNSMLQGDLDNSLASFSNFLINSTVGIGGLFNVAGSKNIKYNDEDFGQTFAKYGSGPGPYLVIPFLGPSNIRDGSGFIVDKLVDPLSFNILEVGGQRDLLEDQIRITMSTVELIDLRERLINIIDDTRKDSFDLYATVRSAYNQNRKFEISKK